MTLFPGNAKFKVRPGLGRFIHSRWIASCVWLPQHVEELVRVTRGYRSSCNFSILFVGIDIL